MDISQGFAVESPSVDFNSEMNECLLPHIS